MTKDPSEFVYQNDNEYSIARHEDERARFGLSEYDWWNFNHYLSYVLSNAMDMFLEKGTGHPVSVSEVEWDAELTIMRDGFKEFAENGFETFDNEKVEAALDLFRKRFYSLWD